MKIIARTRKSHFWNEDRFVLGKNYVMVIDGATPLLKSNNFNEACWLVNYLKKNLHKYEGSIKNRLLMLSKDAFNVMPVKIKEEDYLPSAGASWVEWDDEYFYFSNLGDCEVVVILKNGELKRLSGDALTNLDNLVLEEMKRIALEKGLHIKEARSYVSDMLLRHRKMVNKPGGYNAFTISPKPIISENTFKLKKDEVQEIYLYSDGFASSFESLKIYNNYQEMFNKSLDLDCEIEKIVEESFGDPYCDKYPRFKKIDDITAIKIFDIYGS